MSISKLVKNAALKRIVTTTVGAYEDGSPRKVQAKRLVIPLKRWAREEIKNDGEHAGICQLWLSRKGQPCA